MALFQQLKALRYPLQGLTSDGDSAIAKAAEAVFGKVVHQRCLIHFGRNLDELLWPHYATYPELPREYARFQQGFKRFMYATHWYQVKEWIRFFYFYPTFQRRPFQDARNLIIQTLPQLIPAFFHPAMPRNTNLIENLFRFLDRRITPMDRFQSLDTAEAMVKLLILWYRAHKFTNPSKAYRHMKGKSPLQLAGVRMETKSWLKIGLKK